MIKLQKIFHVLNVITLALASLIVTIYTGPSGDLVHQILLLCLYFLANFLIINKITYWSRLIVPIGLFYLIGFISYYVKFIYYMVDKNFFFTDWTYVNSPMFIATSSTWYLAFFLYIMSNICFFCGVIVGQEFSYIAKIKIVKANLKIEFAEMANHFRKNAKGRLQFLLVLGFFVIVGRYIVINFLNIGHSFGGRSENLAGVSYLAGILQLGTLWGAYLVMGSAFSLSLRYNSKLLNILVYVEVLCFGIISMIGTGSKSELIRLLVVFLIIIIYQRKISDKSMMKMSYYIIAITTIVLVIMYPLLHDYRYFIGETSFSEYISNQKEAIGFDGMEGFKQILWRISGIEYLATIIAYEQSGGIFPSLSLDYAYFFTHTVMGVPISSRTGISMSFWGGLYLIGKYALLFGGSFLFGFIIQRYFPRNDYLKDGYELKIALIACLNLFFISFLLFSGSLLLDAKQVFIIFAIYWTLKTIMPKCRNYNIKWL